MRDELLGVAGSEVCYLLSITFDTCAWRWGWEHGLKTSFERGMGHWVGTKGMNAYHGTEMSRRRSYMYALQLWYLRQI